MAQVLPWEEMITEVEKTYSFTGRKSCSIRMMLGLEIAKRKLGLSDEKIVEQLSSDSALQYFCGFTKWNQEKIPNSSSLTYFRKRISPLVNQKLEIIVAKINAKIYSQKKKRAINC